ncbi:MAG: hypothetical protein ACHQ50_04945 [Fimbriimonadales bacterium]
MLALLAAASVVKLAYSFPVETPRTYDVKTVFDGDIPISLFGGKQSKVEVDLVVTAKGLTPDSQGSAQVISTLDDIKVLLNDEAFPLVNLDLVKPYFPPTTISMSPFGATLKTNAPDQQLPIKLPGLDSKRFPDITYLPLQLPEDGAEVGKQYSFKRAFGDSDIDYAVTPTKVTDDTVEMDLSLAQTYEVLEDAGKQVVKEEKDAEARVKTSVSGKGTATFDRRLGVFLAVNVNANAHSDVTNLATKKDSTRELKTSLAIKLRK